VPEPHKHTNGVDYEHVGYFRYVGVVPVVPVRKPAALPGNATTPRADRPGASWWFWGSGGYSAGVGSSVGVSPAGVSSAVGSSVGVSSAVGSSVGVSSAVGSSDGTGTSA